jgi:hypothetical protein
LRDVTLDNNGSLIFDLTFHFPSHTVSLDPDNIQFVTKSEIGISVGQNEEEKERLEKKTVSVLDPDKNKGWNLIGTNSSSESQPHMYNHE